MALSVPHTSLMRHKMDGDFLECEEENKDGDQLFQPVEILLHTLIKLFFLSFFFGSICWPFSFFFLSLFLFFQNSLSVEDLHLRRFSSNRTSSSSACLPAVFTRRLRMEPFRSNFWNTNSTDAVLSIHNTTIQRNRMWVCQSIPANTQLQIAFCLIHRNQV